MKLYCMTVKAVSSFTSPLHSDTLFGAFCWSYRYIYGEQGLVEEVIRPSQDNTPVCIFSSAFPTGCLPRPWGLRDGATLKCRQETDKDVIKRNYQDAKKKKKAAYISVEWFRRMQAGDPEGFSEGLVKDSLVTVQPVRNSVDRISGTVVKTEEGSHLYALDEHYLEHGQPLDIYIYTAFEKEKLLPVLRLMFRLGIGGKKSSGKGQFIFCDSPDPLQDCQRLLDDPAANAVVTLSEMIPAKRDPSQGFYKTFVKFGKMDREYANGESPFKKPLLFLRNGALFMPESRDALHSWYGRCVTGVSAEHPEVIVSGYTIALPIMIGK